MKKRYITDTKTALEMILAIFVIIIVVAFNFMTIYSQARSNVIRSCENDVLKESAIVENLLVESIHTVDMTAYTVAEMMEEDATSDMIRHYLETESQIAVKTVDESSSNGLYGFFNDEYIDGVGWVPDDDYVPQERPWYTGAYEMKGETTLVTPYLDAQTGTVIMSVSKLLPDKKSVLAMDVELSGIQKHIEKVTASSVWDMAMVLAPEAVVAAHSDETEKGKDYSMEKDSFGAAVYSGLKSAEGNHFEIRYGGKEYFVFVSDVKSGWRVITVTGTADLLSSVNRIYFIFLLSLLAVFSILFFVMRKMRRRKELAEAVSRQLESVAKVFFSVHLIDLVNDTYSVLTQSESVKSVIGDEPDRAQYRFRLAMDALTDPRYKGRIFDFIDFDTLDKRLEGREYIMCEFISNMNDRCYGRFVPVERDEEDRLTKVMWMVEIVEKSGVTK